MQIYNSKCANIYKQTHFADRCMIIKHCIASTEIKYKVLSIKYFDTQYLILKSIKYLSVLSIKYQVLNTFQ